MFWTFKRKVQTLIKVDIDTEIILKGQKEGSCYLTVSFPTDMPEEEKEAVKRRLENIVDDIRKYL